MDSEGTTIKKIAQLLDLSITTVSRVLNGKAKQYRISQKTEDLVKETATRLNFQPNQIAQNLRLKRTNTIGLAIPDISNPFFANLARTIEIELRRQGKLILLCDTNDNTELERETLSLLIGRKVDGLLVAPVGLYSDHLKQVGQVPLVLIDRYFEDLSIPYVATDNQLGAYEATQYLIEKGHQRIACIQGLPNTISNKERIKGFSQAIKDYQLNQDNISLLGGDFSIENGYESALTLLEKTHPPTAIFTLNNQIALGAMQVIQEAGLSIPHDISLISFDEQPYFQLTNPPISTIKQPIEQIGKEAVQSLFRLMTRQAVENKLLPPTLIERASVNTIS